MKSLFYNRILERIGSNEAVRTLHRRFEQLSFPLEPVGPKGSFAAFICADLVHRRKTDLLIITPTEQEAEDLREDLQLFGVPSLLFPGWETAPYHSVAVHSPVFGRRVHVLSELAAGAARVVVAPLRAALTPVPPPAYIRSRSQTVAVGDTIDPPMLAERLVREGYLRVPRVGLRGEFALRGEVLDIYPPGATEGLRIVFEFDEIEQIRLFDPESQSSTGTVESARIHPSREVVWDEELVNRLRDVWPQAVGGEPDEAVLESLLIGAGHPGEERYYPLVCESRATLAEYFGAAVVLLDYERLKNGSEAYHKETAKLYLEAKRDGPAPKPESLLHAFERLEESSRLIRFHTLSAREPAIRFAYDPPRSYFGNMEFFREELGYLLGAGYQVYILADNEAQAARIGHMLSESLESGKLEILPESISSGFAVPDAKLCIVQENEIFGRRKRVAQSVKKAESSAIDTFVDLSSGDYVVHVGHGIGRYQGISRIKAAGFERDYMHLEYAGGEYVYIPIEQVNLVQRYIGHGGTPPRLDTIGGKSWENRKSKVRKSVEDLAEHLIKLYSQRKRARGFAFPPDIDWQYDFEAGFPFEETPDQLRCIAEVKQDMEKPAPMDRLVCGDVGYGKTEIAMRAAFKAVSAGKQVALLAPTTILAEQHYENLNERLKKFPVKTAMLSRFVPKPEQKKALAALAKGDVDLVVGTHRILQKDVVYADLGLIIVDEEQRFGVKDKERLKELKHSVDSLTLTATPIPRTLHMSLLKIRDMSILQTPPNNRLPIETVIRQFSEEDIAMAIQREIERGGQVYFLHNRIETLGNVKLFIERLLPEVMVEAAHGQMSPTRLEDIMHRFIHGGFQVLVSTTIIENGIDIPNVNTIIIDRADMYGIAQLYQLRGRVGRSDRPAYAYLFYPEERALSEIAMKRLQIISDYTELGSGFKIALKDLEVRGAGNLLGSQQSGDILSVGFDMYLRLLDEAIRELDAEMVGEPEIDVYLELEYSGFIPDAYIDEALEKMALYKRIAGIGSDDELISVVADLEDRFGPMPDEVQSLLSLAEIRILCRRLKISSLRERKGVVEVEFSKLVEVSVDRVLRMIESSGGKVRLNPHRPDLLLLDTGGVGLKEKSEFIRGRLSSLL